MRRSRLWRLLALACSLLLFAAACGDDDGGAAQSPTGGAGATGGGTATGPTELNVAMIFLNTIEEPYNTSFLQSWERVAAEKPHGLTINFEYTENVAPPDAERVLRELATSGQYQMIFAHSTYSDQVKVLKDEFPEIAWGFTGSGNEGLGGNAYWLDVFVHEPAYLMGIIAGMMTETNVIGSVAAFPFPNVNAPLNGYIEGAKSVNPDVAAKATYIESWFDPPKAKESATAQISAGADFVYAERFGPFEAVTENPGTYAFGHFVDQSSLAPQVVVTSAIAKWDPSILVAIDGWWAHVAEAAAYAAPTDRIVFTMKDGGADLAPYHELDSVIPQDVKDAVDQAKADILSGSLVVTMNEEPVTSD